MLEAVVKSFLRNCDLAIEDVQLLRDPRTSEEIVTQKQFAAARLQGRICYVSGILVGVSIVHSFWTTSLLVILIQGIVAVCLYAIGSDLLTIFRKTNGFLDKGEQGWRILSVDLVIPNSIWDKLKGLLKESRLSM